MTKCDGKGCSAKDKCYRYTTKGSFRQAFFIEAPGVDEKCEYFKGN